MTTAGNAGADDWVKLADLEKGTREPLMQKRYEELAALPEDERKRRLKAMEEAAYNKLSEDKLRSFTLSRMQVWLRMDPEMVQKVSHSYDAFIDEAPGPIAMRHVAVVQTVVREFSPEEHERLRSLFPRVFGALPSTAAVHAVVRPEEAAKAPAKKPWWAFWKK